MSTVRDSLMAELRAAYKVLDPARKQLLLDDLERLLQAQRTAEQRAATV